MRNMQNRCLPLLLCLFMLSSCADQYFEDMRVEFYTRNFIKEFGLINENQDWNMANSTSVKVNLGSEMASSVKVYAKYGDTYYKVADLCDISGSINVPIDIPKSSDRIMVRVDGKEYFGNLGMPIDCVDPRGRSRSSMDADGNFSYDPSDASYTYDRNDCYIEITDEGYAYFNAQQMGPIVAKDRWASYWSLSTGRYNDNDWPESDWRSKGIVPEISTENQLKGNMGNSHDVSMDSRDDFVTQDFDFIAKDGWFTIHPMFYGSNQVHTLGVYLIDDYGNPRLDSEGNIIKIPIYESKQGDDIQVKAGYPLFGDQTPVTPPTSGSFNITLQDEYGNNWPVDKDTNPIITTTHGTLTPVVINLSPEQTGYTVEVYDPNDWDGGRMVVEQDPANPLKWYVGTRDTDFTAEGWWCSFKVTVNGESIVRAFMVVVEGTSQPQNPDEPQTVTDIKLYDSDWNEVTSTLDVNVGGNKTLVVRCYDNGTELSGDVYDQIRVEGGNSYFNATKSGNQVTIEGYNAASDAGTFTVYVDPDGSTSASTATVKKTIGVSVTEGSSSGGGGGETTDPAAIARIVVEDMTISYGETKDLNFTCYNSSDEALPLADVFGQLEINVDESGIAWFISVTKDSANKKFTVSHKQNSSASGTGNYRISVGNYYNASVKTTFTITANTASGAPKRYAPASTKANKAKAPKQTAKRAPRSRAEVGSPEEYAEMSAVGGVFYHDEDTEWQPINMMYNTEYGTVDSYSVEKPLLVRSKGYRIQLMYKGRPYTKRFGMYIDYMWNPNEPRDLTITSGLRPDHGTHYSKKAQNRQTFDGVTRDGIKWDNIDGRTYEFSYATTFIHPRSGLRYLTFEDWPVTQPSTSDKSIDGYTSTNTYPTDRFNWGGDGSGVYSSDRDLNDIVYRINNIEEVFSTVTPTNEEGFSWIWALEDLGSTDDFDFNDLVMRVKIITTTREAATEGGEPDMVRVATFTPLAAGGTLPLYVHFEFAYNEYLLTPGEFDLTGSTIDLPLAVEGSTAEEFHKWFGIDNHSLMINTGRGPVVGPDQIRSCVLTVPKDFRLNLPVTGGATYDAYNYRFYVSVNSDKSRQQIDADRVNGDDSAYLVPLPQKGQAAQSFIIVEQTIKTSTTEGGDKVDASETHVSNWRWPLERSHILDAYPRFKNWIADPTYIGWYKDNVNSEHLY